MPISPILSSPLTLVTAAKTTIDRAFGRNGARWAAPGQIPDISALEQPFRNTLLGTEQLEHHAREVAGGHAEVHAATNLRSLLAALERNAKVLQAAYATLTEDTRGQLDISPAAEWLLDNFHIIADQIREVRQDLPSGYYRELPRLSSGPFANQPRVYALALELIAHTDSRIDPAQLLSYVNAYQSVTPLYMGELWAVAIMLRAGLIENLARLARMVIAARQARAAANYWADQLLQQNHGTNVLHSPALAALMREHPRLSPTFAVQLVHQLSNYDGEHDVGPLITWLEQQPMMPFNTIEALIHAEHQRQAAAQASVGNAITSMRTLNAIDWANWFERVSLVEQVLHQDPAGAYARSTFATRDRYRHVVERLARRSRFGELDVAWRAVVRARHAPPGDPRATHIGYYLVDEGAAAFANDLGYAPLPGERLRDAVLQHPTATYLGALAVVTSGLVLAARRLSAPGRGAGGAALAAGLLALPASALAKELVDRVLTRTLTPRVLPRLDLRDGIPPDLRTMVVVPTLLLTPDSVHTQLAALEVLYLANDDPHLHFALLTDFADAPAAAMPEDGALLDVAVEGINTLNQRHGHDRFFLLHRARMWNEHESSWMGWERKRGKLEEFNRLLGGDTETTFSTQIGDLSVLLQVRYVITLDADTQLPRDAAHTLIGTLAHPLNRAAIDPTTQRVVRGYGILQPRVAIDLVSATRSRFARLGAGNIGIDPYTTAVSDVYMDLFGEGIFAGKGIYDPQVLRTVLHGRFPDNTLLSHDLIEGVYARAALLSDVELFDSYPSTYAAAAARQHRWVRGDWQIAAWVGNWTPSATGWVRNQLPVISRFKLLDNLRRSLVPPATIALLADAWFGARSMRRALVGTTAALLPAALPLLFELGDAALAFARGPGRIALLRQQRAQLLLSGERVAMNVATLPVHAWLNADAIARTLWRVLFTRQHLLEWETAAQTQGRLTSSSSYLLSRMLPMLGAVVAAAVVRQHELAATWLSAAPVIAAWASSPALVQRLDQPWQTEAQPLDDAQRALLRKLARATWAYFEQFVVPEQHFLAPDNFQETPRPLVAARTSPTNIGLQLLADLAAFDLGYLGLWELTTRTEQVFATLDRLEHYRGHLLNWYDTETLRPLPPAYVSTVDSGNLAGALLVLRQGFLALPERPVIGPNALDGLRDTLAQLREYLPTDQPPQSLAALDALLEHTPTTIGEYRALLAELIDTANTVPPQPQLAEPWRGRLLRQATGLLDDLRTLLPDGAGDQEAPPALRDAPGATALLARQAALAEAALARFEAMDFSFLYDTQRRIFVIGYSVAEARRDNSFYDLLASEARLSSFLAIAKGDVPQEHWFHIGRTLLDSGVGPVLASWSGTMFEYLMPLLFMRSYSGTLLDDTCRVAVARQIQYGRQQQVPWGVSESAYNARDPAMNYQYRAFGVPRLGLKRGLGSDLVITPYATALALPVAPRAALDNLIALLELGMNGAYGLYEAIDYTIDRLPPGSSHAIVRSFMVHHQGMSLLAFANYLCGDGMPARLHAEPIVQAAEMLLQERVAGAAPLFRPNEAAEARTIVVAAQPATRQFTTPATPVPYTQILSNGSYSVMLTNAGGGFSATPDLAVTRWCSDVARDNWGTFFYIRDVRSDMTWSAAYQPLRREPEGYQAMFGLDKVEFRQQIAGIASRMEVTIAPEDGVEIRRIWLANMTAAPRELEVTSYAEVVLAPPQADAAHPAFSNLFVETEFVPASDALLASRRPRSAAGSRPWLVHTVAVQGHTIGVTQYETDRAAFLGRGRTPADPQALYEPLGQHVGTVLDPIVSLRRRVRIVPGGSAQIVFATTVTESRDRALELADRYHDVGAVARALTMAWTQTQVELRHLNIISEDAHRFQRLASSALYLDALKRASPEVLAENSKGQPGLWAYGISGDAPIIVVRVAANDDLTLVRELLQAHQYWRLKRLTIDLVLLNEEAGGYMQERQENILSLVRSSGSSVWLNQRGGIFVLRADTLPAADLTLLMTVARALLSTRRGSLGQHLRRREQPSTPLAPPAQPDSGAKSTQLPPPKLGLRAPFGGFSPDGSEYIIELGPGETTPAPWSNIIANEHAGFLITERGGGYTWAENSRENRLTPWSNDPASDPASEGLYLRDDETGEIWSPAALPAGGGYFRVRHGFGYSAFEHTRDSIGSELRLAVPPDDPVKLIRLRLENTGDESRQISVTYYAEWVLGVFRDQMAPYLITEFDAETSALLAYNPYNQEFVGRVAFLACSERDVSVSGDRLAFIGRNGDLAQPAALRAPTLDGKVGAGFDPCGALRCALTLGAGEARELVFLLGQGTSREAARTLIERYRAPEAAAHAEAQSVAQWRTIVRQTEVRTPDADLNTLLNGWLLYQTLVCRIYARSAFYQSGGAYGYRDQLQDVMALLHSAPELARAQIMRAAARQFIEGDVQHWWHPPSGRGIRTSFSDDYLWLPYVVAVYTEVTGDAAVLDEIVPFIEGHALAPGEAEYYDLPERSNEHGSVYEHCVRALDYGLGRIGQHGLPLMGGGDWNDGMNMVGHEGRGESVWVGWFLYTNLMQFANLAEHRADTARAAHYRNVAAQLQRALETHAWDGEWYLRAFYDDGTPLGSSTSNECQIDSLTQSWAVISGAGDPARARQGMAAIEQHLVDREAGLIKLFTPPFDKTTHDPGYIKGYVPGVRENGGQYTHAAIWVIWAYTLLGDGARAAELLRLINPIRHAREHLDTYKVEPYTIAADVYSAADHLGRGGWTWYTGSAGWLYRLGIEQLLGLRRTGATLALAPCLPPDWPGYSACYRYGASTYHIEVRRIAADDGARAGQLTLDGVPTDGHVPLIDDGAEHRVDFLIAEG
ncbi:MAG TPA: glucoamylase family protein [Kouleothrix sp.]|nr:glucoamylase family protein [Kouleothrix sp.]